MGVLITASGRVLPDRPLEAARLLADCFPPAELAKIVRFILDNGRGNVILGVKDRRVIGARIELILY